MANPCEWNGTRYPSQAAVAEVSGFHPNTIDSHLKRFGHLDNLGKLPSGPRKGHRRAQEAGTVDFPTTGSRYAKKPASDSLRGSVSMPTVRHLLSCGYGVEDIARKLRVTPDAVRGVVADLRVRGVLRRMWPKKGDAA